MASRALLLLFVFAALGCESRAALGASCVRASECTAPLVCSLSRCRSECREQRDCPIGALCVLDPTGNGSCALPDDPDCRVSGCTGELACVGSVCVNLCSSIAECPPGSQCVPTTDGRARCARGEDVDAGTLDATADDDGGSSCDASTSTPSPCDPIVQMAAGDAFTCVRTESRQLWCWGAIDSLARGPSPSGCVGNACYVPAHPQIEHPSGNVHDATDVRWVSARRYGACMVTGGEPVTCWVNTPSSAPLGSDSNGEYARPVLTVTSGPLVGAAEVQLTLPAGIVARTDGSWAAWGDDSLGIFGAEPTGDHLRAIEIDAPLAGAITTRFGDTHGCAIVDGATAGEVWCWGGNDHGQAGDVLHMGAGATVLHATQVPGVSGATELALGEVQTCALIAAGEIACWGELETLGNDTPDGCLLAIAGTAGEPDEYGCPVTRVARAGSAFRRFAEQAHGPLTCAIDLDDDLWCWGRDWNGRSPVPVRIELPRPVTSAVTTWSHVCAVADGAVYCWGENDYGQLGRVTTGTSDVLPAPVVWE
jgi:hypothetical protein